MSLSKLSLTLLCASCLSLTACSMAKLTDKAYDWQYDTTESRAKNIGDVFGLKGVSDAELPKDAKIDKDSILLNGSINSGLLHWGSHFGTGATGVGALGCGFGFALLDSALRGDPFEMQDGYFGYVPVSKAKVGDQAGKQFLDHIVTATKKAAKELGITKKFKIVVRDAYIWGEPDRYAGKNIYFVNERSGCKITDDPKNSCLVKVYVSHPEQQTVITPVIVNGKVIPAWKIESRDIDRAALGYDSLTLYRGDSDQFPYNKYDLYPIIAKYLPQYAYIYSAPAKTKEYTYRMPPMIYEKNKTLFFVKPQR